MTLLSGAVSSYLDGILSGIAQHAKALSYFLRDLENLSPARKEALNSTHSRVPGVITMILIREIVQQALVTGCLSVEAENQLRQLLKNKYDSDDLKAFIKLQHAVVDGGVRQESRQRQDEHFYYSKLTNPALPT